MARRGIPAGTQPNAQMIEALKENVETLTGQRNNRLAQLGPPSVERVTAAPTADDFNKLLDDVRLLRTKLNELIDRSDGDA